jgi:hypothetical protein
MLKQHIKSDMPKHKTATKSSLSFVPMLPDDHGAYAMLLVPLVIGLVVGIGQPLAEPSPPLIIAFPLLTLALLAAFFLHAPLEVLAKPNVSALAKRRAQIWLIIYLAFVALSGFTLLFLSNWYLWGLLGLGFAASIPLGVDLISRKWRKQRSLGVRLFGISGLVLSAPLSYYVATTHLDSLALALWWVSFIYFGSSLFYVRIWFETKKLEKARKLGESVHIPGWLWQATLLYHVVGFLSLLGLISLHILAWSVLLVFAPLVAKLVMALRNPPYYIPIKKVGLFEFAQSFVFALLLLLSLSI